MSSSGGNSEFVRLVPVGDSASESPTDEVARPRLGRDEKSGLLYDCTW